MMNVLFIVVDDLRPEFNVPYSQKTLVTPHIDEFSKTSLTFSRAYAQFSHCSPSRNSFMTGRSPQTTGVYNFVEDFRLVGPDWTTLPQFFKQQGYLTIGGGKLFHPNKPPKNDPPSWTGGTDGYWYPNEGAGSCPPNETIYDNICPSVLPDNQFVDGRILEAALPQLAKAAANASRPWFLGVGFHRPHRPWHTPRRFYELYPNNGSAPINMRLAKHKTAPAGMPPLAYINNVWPALNMTPDEPIPDHVAAMGRWGYYSSVSFTDYNVGRLLSALEESGAATSTVVSLIGDHGWELGEHAEWCKRTNFEIGVRVPLMIRSPRHAAASYGQQTAHLAEALDLYRTLAALALPADAPPVEDGVEGVDLSPIFADPALAHTLPARTAAYSQMARCPAAGTLGPDSACNEVPRHLIPYMGYTVRVDSWRYTAWLPFNGTRNRADWNMAGAKFGEELYSHAGDDGTDFDAWENVNHAKVDTSPATEAVRDQLLSMLKKQFA